MSSIVIVCKNIVRKVVLEADFVSLIQFLVSKYTQRYITQESYNRTNGEYLDIGLKLDDQDGKKYDYSPLF